MMGRTEPSIGRPPPAFRRDARAKRARATINKVVPSLLTAHPRARRGIEQSELIIDPPRLVRVRDEANQEVEGYRKSPRRKGQRKTGGNRDDESFHVTQQQISKHKPPQRSDSAVPRAPRISVRVADTLEAARSLCVASDGSKPGRGAHKVGILNMASPLHPGGGFLNGATSQEESLCMRTTLLPSLRDEFYRLPELGVVYTPDVLVFRSSSTPASSTSENDDDGILPKADRYFVDVVTAAMLRLPDTEEDTEEQDPDADEEERGETTSRGSKYVNAADRELAISKMRAVMRVFASRGCKKVVLGAWGCGAYGNPTREIAAAFRRILDPSSVGSSSNSSSSSSSSSSHNNKKNRGLKDLETWTPHVEEVVFAIKDARMAMAFARAFGEDILVDSLGEEDDTAFSPSGENDSVEDVRLRELRSKIAELEIQVQQARSSQLRSGLQTVLAGLRRQLPTEEKDRDERNEAFAIGKADSGELQSDDESVSEEES
ncbi:hypothetical protein F5Y16DRAFT_88356 [Xylariaceae sp. FL0255]|nr:hypothetical protein F5Y16DRAFT_88356 [Xylariaceae sp. FL0255]